MDAFLRALWADPESVPLRMAFADYLDEQGDSRGDTVRWATYCSRMGLPMLGESASDVAYLLFVASRRPGPSNVRARFPMPGLELDVFVRDRGLLSSHNGKITVLMPCPQEAARA